MLRVDISIRIYLPRENLTSFRVSIAGNDVSKLDSCSLVGPDP